MFTTQQPSNLCFCEDAEDGGDQRDAGCDGVIKGGVLRGSRRPNRWLGVIAPGNYLHISSALRARFLAGKAISVVHGEFLLSGHSSSGATDDRVAARTPQVRVLFLVGNDIL